MRASRAADKEEKPQGYRHSQTDGYSSTDRVTRRYESDSAHAWVPIVMGFRPNEELA